MAVKRPRKSPSKKSAPTKSARKKGPSKKSSRKKSPPADLANVLASVELVNPIVKPTLRFSAAGTHFGAAASGVETEPVFDTSAREDIQGNIVPGFRKDHQHFLFYKLGRTPSAKRWLRWIAPLITSMDDSLAFVRAFRALRDRLGAHETPLKATWINLAVSVGAIAKLVSREDADAFGDESFRQGLAARAEFLGDPSSPAGKAKKNWVVGGPGQEADVLVIVAADDPTDLGTMLRRVKERADADGLKLLYEQRGQALPGTLRGHEHFGFKDGVSQPGIRGRVSEAPTDFITPRYFDPSDSRARLFARPGQPLVWPGEVLLGESRQNPEDLYAPAPPATNFPKWAHRGSYVVCRRLRQDVRAFWAFAAAQSAALGMAPEHFASMLVGRWPSGAPVMRTPAADNAALAGDDLANNHFLFDDDTRPSVLTPIPGYPGDTHAQARADVLGTVCPHFAHIRKVNPRDGAGDLGKTSDTLIRAIFRRGIAFGPPVVGVKNPSPSLWKKERGLIFVSYQSSIESQFEFLLRQWTNSSLQPNVGGHDPIIGQTHIDGSRDRFIDFPQPGGARRIAIKGEWVIATGGGYFFAPPISAIGGVLGA